MTNAAVANKNDFVPSPQQSAIFNWVRTGKGSAFVEAVAGAGKSTTGRELCKVVPSYKNIAFVAFSKNIADENKEKMSKMNLRNVNVGTFHSFGLSAWRKINPKVVVDAKKSYKLLEDILDKEDSHLASFIANLVSLAKQRALGLFGDVKDQSKWYDIVDHYDMTSDLEDPTKDLANAIAFAQLTLEKSVKVADTIIDFDDMIYMPVISGCRMWQYDIVIVDEAQDTNPARRALIRKMLKDGGRVIFVGDRCQSIFGFTGADSDAVDQIIQDFDCCDLPLTVTYRCPKNVVALARTVVDHIEAHPSAPDGIVSYIEPIREGGKHTWQSDLIARNLHQDDAILCRNTKPLVDLAFYLIRKNIPCHVEGKDIGKGLMNLITRWKVTNIDKLKEKLEDYCEKECQKLVAKKRETLAEALRDKIETIFVLMEGCPDIACIKAKIEMLFQDSNGNQRKSLTLSTVHKAKGREWNRTFILGDNMYFYSKAARQAWQKVQEKNIVYVAYTRAKQELVLINV